MLDLLQITNDPVFAQRCDAIDGVRLFVDLESLGKLKRQAGRNTFISSHALEDVGRVKAVLRRAKLMVRLNPPNPGTAAEVEAVLAQGADMLMLPMFTNPGQVHSFAHVVAGRVPIVLLLENGAALDSMPEWIATPGVNEIFVGMNDLHMSLGHAFMFEPLALGLVDRVAQAAKQQGLRFGFGGIARLDEGLLPGRDVLAEHLRLASGAVILSRSFHRGESGMPFEQEVARLRTAEAQLACRDAVQVQADSQRIAATIRSLAVELATA